MMVQPLRFFLRHSSPLILSQPASFRFGPNTVTTRSFGKKKGKGKVIFNTAPAPSFHPPPEEVEGLSVPPNEYLQSLVERRRKGKLNSEEEKLWLMHHRYNQDRLDRLTSDQRHLLDLFSVASNDDIPSLSRLRRGLEFNGLLQHTIALEAHVASLLDNQEDAIEQARCYQRAADLAKDLRDYTASRRWYRKATAVCRQALMAQAEAALKDNGDATEAMMAAVDLYEAALVQCIDTSDTIPIQEEVGGLLVRLGRVGEGLARYELALQHSEWLAQKIVEKETCLPKDAPLVESLGARIARLRELVRTTTMELMTANAVESSNITTRHGENSAAG